MVTYITLWLLRAKLKKIRGCGSAHIFSIFAIRKNYLILLRVKTEKLGGVTPPPLNFSILAPRENMKTLGGGGAENSNPLKLSQNLLDSHYKHPPKILKEGNSDNIAYAKMMQAMNNFR